MPTPPTSTTIVKASPALVSGCTSRYPTVVSEMTVMYKLSQADQPSISM